MRTTTTARTLSEIHESLQDDLMHAIESGQVSASVATPGYGTPSMPLGDLLTDQFAGQNDTVLAGLVALWAAALKSSDAAVKHQATALKVAFAQQHADWHRDDAAAAEDEDLPVWRRLAA